MIDTTVLCEAAHLAFAPAATILRGYAAWSIEIDRHASAERGDALNLRLSLERAAAVRRGLIDREGPRIDLLKTAGFLSRRPAVPDFSPDGPDDSDVRGRNRRVEIIIAKEGQCHVFQPAKR